MKPTLLAVLTLVLCAPGFGGSAETPPALQLPATVRPLRHALDLTIVPTADDFSGSIVIEVELGEATPLLWLNATELSVSVASAEVGGTTATAKLVAGGDDFVGLAFDPALAPGRAKLHLAFSGRFSKTATHGLFTQKEGADWYAFSQFEAIEARRAFPCFDEPGIKAPWQLTLHVKKDHAAISNTPITAESDETGSMKKVVFAETPPLPSYLVALAVGPFDIVDGGKVGKKKVPFKIAAPRGMGEQGRYAATITPEILARLEDYFGSPYPFSKLDQVAIPQTVAFGAMENAGMVTYSQSSLLSRPEDLSVAQKRGLANTIAHELAHQWVGDLVTMAWWDDIWLNEGFATWMAAKIVDGWKPEWDVKVSRVRSASGAMSSDGLLSARKVRQPIASKGDIENAFDGITYQKGAAALTMFEAWIGPQAFQKGVRRYLKDHAWGNATAADFLAALTAEGRPELAAGFSSFLDQPGVPLISVELSCKEGQAPRLVLGQRRYLPQGSKGSADETWKLPVCARFGSGRTVGHACVLLTAAAGELVLSEAKACPDWVLANDAYTGYYRVTYKGDLLARLFKDEARVLSLPEKIGALADVQALVRSGEVPMSEALALVPMFAKDPNRHLAAAAAGIASGVGAHLVSDELRPNYARFIRGMFGERAHELGFTARATDDDDTKLLRQTLVPMVADDGEDQALREAARQLAQRWLGDHSAVDPDMVGAVLSAAALDGGRELYDSFRLAAKKAAERRDRTRLLGALGGFRDPAIARDALGLLLSEEFDVREAGGILWRSLDDKHTRDLAWSFLKDNSDAYLARIPRESAARLPSAAASFCDVEHRAEAEAFFKDRLAKFPGAERNLAQALERVSLCAAQKAAQQASVAGFLTPY